MKLALVTGGSRGIGRATSLLLVNKAGILFQQCRTGQLVPVRPAYAASKGALDTLTRGLSLEVAQQGGGNGVRPGFIYTEMHADGGEPGRVDRLASVIPMERGGKAEEVRKRSSGWLATRPLIITDSIIDAAGGR